MFAGGLDFSSPVKKFFFDPLGSGKAFVSTVVSLTGEPRQFFRYFRGAQHPVQSPAGAALHSGLWCPVMAGSHSAL